MPDLSDLLNGPFEDLEETLVPEGIWDGTLARAAYYKDRDGEALTDRHGKEYTRVVLYVKCTEAVDVIDENAADQFLSSGASEETLAGYNKLFYNRRDVKNLLRTLSKLGVDVVNKPLEDIFKSIKPDYYPARFNIETDEYQGTKSSVVTRLMPID